MIAVGHLPGGPGRTAAGVVETGGMVGTRYAVPASANTKGSWSQLDGSIDIDARRLLLWLGANLADQVQFLVDVGVGPAGDEQVLLGNAHWCNDDRIYDWLQMPLRVPQAARVAVRAQGNVGSEEIDIGALLVEDRGPAGSIVDTFGADETDSGGTAVDNPGDGTWGSWVEFSASTPRDLVALGMCVGTRGNGVMASQYWQARIGVGAAGDEQVVFDRFAARIHTNNILMPALMGVVPMFIPKGSRLSVATLTYIADATDRLMDVVVLGVAA